MKCLLKWKWIKLPRDIEMESKGLMTYYTRLAKSIISCTVCLLPMAA